MKSEEHQAEGSYREAPPAETPAAAGGGGAALILRRSSLTAPLVLQTRPHPELEPEPGLP